MKMVLSRLAMIFILVSACKKENENSNNNNNNSGSKLSLIQHEWQLVSYNGEALRYTGKPGDYYNFSSDLFLYTYVNATYDTLIYKLLSDSETLRLYPVKNNIRTNDSLDYHIGVLDDHQFILTYYGTNPPVFAVDSLKR